MRNGKKVLVGRSIRDVWVAYGKSGHKKAKKNKLRNQLVDFYLPLVRYHAQQIHGRLPKQVELDDLISVGVLGLIDAIDGFDLKRGLSFKTFSAPRIRGSILDELRAVDWVPRLTRTRHRTIEKARNNLCVVLGREPTDKELSTKLGVTATECGLLIRGSKIVYVTSHSKQRFADRSESGEDTTLAEVFESSDRDPYALVSEMDLRELILRDLNETLKLIVILRDFEGWTTKEVAAHLLMSEAWVFHLRKKAIAQIKSNPDVRKFYRESI